MHGKAAATIHPPRPLSILAEIPRPNSCSTRRTSRLRAAGVSGMLCQSIARPSPPAQSDGTVPTHAAIKKMSGDEIIERLTAVRVELVARTVEMLLIFLMGRPDVLPVSDYGVRKGFTLTFQRVPKTRPLCAEDPPKADVLFKRGKTMGAIPLRGQLVSPGAPAILPRAHLPAGPIQPTIAKYAGFDRSSPASKRD